MKNKEKINKEKHEVKSANEKERLSSNKPLKCRKRFSYHSNKIIVNFYRRYYVGTPITVKISNFFLYSLN